MARVKHYNPETEKWEYSDTPFGINGIPATHSWDGTKLTITSASGTSTVDLKGEPGAAGKTPVKGTDYYTDADKAEIINAVLTELPSAEGVAF